MTKKETLTFLEKEKLIAIVRLFKREDIQPTIKQLVQGGIKVLEITSNTPGYIAEIGTARKLYPKIIIGAGTITCESQAIDAIKGGAQFLVTPNTEASIVRAAHGHDIPVVMGALTPTEICKAVTSGADIIKLFPAGIMGLDYFKSIKGPLNDIKFFVVGAIGPKNIHDWLSAGALGMGIGNKLTDREDESKGFEQIKEKAEKFIKEFKVYQ